jgi:nucleotide-binding universal stress UspA family protein
MSVTKANTPYLDLCNLNKNNIMLKILIPTDFSAQSDFALIYAQKIAGKVPVSLTLLHVIPCKTEARLSADGKVEVEDDSVQSYLESRVGATEKGFDLYDLTPFTEVQKEVQFGPVGDMIVTFSKMNPQDLIIMGTKGAFGLKEIMSGSLTQMVSRACKTPILSLMCDRADQEINNIMLVHKIHSDQAKIPKVVKVLVEAFGARLHLLQNADAKDAVLSEDVQQFLDQNGWDKTPVTIHQGGVTEQKIIELDQKHPMDMIVIATEGKSSFLQIFSRSVAEKLVNHMFKPIITFHI